MKMIPEYMLNDILRFAGINAKTSTWQLSPIAGGDINDAYSLSNEGQKYFLKLNDAQAFPSMFEKEAAGLKLLSSSSSFSIPSVKAFGTVGQNQFLLLEFIESGARHKDFWETFAFRLAEMHKHSATAYGLDHDNYIGSLSQDNGQMTDWGVFFIENRLRPLLDLAQSKGALGTRDSVAFEHLFTRIPDLFPEESPSLLHGDLWSGNFMRGPDGHAIIYDPAAYFGHREMDIAMTKLFGGFDSSFYDYYDAFYPLADGWEERIDLCNLYPLLVHVNLFGGSYAQQIRNILHRFSP